MVRVLLVSNAFGMGGTERNVMLYARELAGLGAEVRIHPIVDGGVLREKCVEWLAPEFAGGKTADDVIGRLRAHVGNWTPDVVHALGTPADIAAAIVAHREPRTRFVFAVQNHPLYHTRRSRLVIRWASRFADLVITDGRGTREYVTDELRFPAERVRTLIDGVDPNAIEPTRPREQTRDMLGASSGQLLIGCVARLYLPQKGQDILLDAIATLPADGVRYVLVGDGPDRDRLRNKAEHLGVVDRVTFAGTRRDLGDVLRALDALVIPSRWESIPKTLLEGMAAGVPIVTTAAGDITEVVTDGRTALVVPPGDPYALARAMERAIRDEALRTHLGETASAEIEQRGLLLSSSVERLLRWYEEMLAAGGREARRTPGVQLLGYLWTRLGREQLRITLPYMRKSVGLAARAT